MLIKFLKVAAVGAVITLGVYVGYKLVQKYKGAEAEAEETAEEEVAEEKKVVNSDVVLPQPKKPKLRVVDPELEALKNEIANQLRKKLRLLGTIGLNYMDQVEEQAEASAKHILKLKREEEEEARRASILADLIPMMDERIEVEYELTGSYFPGNESFGPLNLQFRGVFRDELTFKRNWVVLRPLMALAVLAEMPGTKEYSDKYRPLYGILMPSGYLAPLRDVKRTSFDDILLMNQFLKFRQFGLDEPMDLDKYKPDTLSLGPNGDWYEPLHLQYKTLISSEKVLAKEHRETLPRWWRNRVVQLQWNLEEHFEGYTTESEARAQTYLACLYAARNCVWDLPHHDMAYFDIAVPLFKYCVYKLRELLFTEECLMDNGPADNGPAVDAFEELLSLIAIPHPTMGDHLGHTAMIRVGKA